MRHDERRRLQWALEALVKGDPQYAARLIAFVLHVEAPEVSGPRLAGELRPLVIHDLRGRNGQPACRIVPQPSKRLIDHRALEDYATHHPACEVGGCAQPPCPEPHHLIPRGARTRTSSDLVRLCAFHHSAYHALGGREWLRVTGPLLSQETIQKVERALGQPCGDARETK